MDRSIISLDKVKFDEPGGGLVSLDSVKFDKEPLAFVEPEKEGLWKGFIKPTLTAAGTLAAQTALAPGAGLMAALEGMTNIGPGYETGNVIDFNLPAAQRRLEETMGFLPSMLTPEERAGVERGGLIFKPIEWGGKAAQALVRNIPEPFMATGTEQGPLPGETNYPLRDTVAEPIAGTAGEALVMSLLGLRRGRPTPEVMPERLRLPLTDIIDAEVIPPPAGLLEAPRQFLPPGQGFEMVPQETNWQQFFKPVTTRTVGETLTFPEDVPFSPELASILMAARQPRLLAPEMAETPQLPPGQGFEVIPPGGGMARMEPGELGMGPRRNVPHRKHPFSLNWLPLAARTPRLLAPTEPTPAEILTEKLGEIEKKPIPKEVVEPEAILKLENSLLKWREQGLNQTLPKEYNRYADILSRMKNGEKGITRDVTEETIRETGALLQRAVKVGKEGKTLGEIADEKVKTKLITQPAATSGGKQPWLEGKSWKTSFIPETLYHETSLENFKEFNLDNVYGMYVSNDPVLAIGQQGRGVLIKYKPNMVKGYVDYSKPGSKFLADQGKYEIITEMPRYDTGGKIIDSIILKKDLLDTMKTDEAFSDLYAEIFKRKQFDIDNAIRHADGSIEIPWDVNKMHREDLRGKLQSLIKSPEVLKDYPELVKPPAKEQAKPKTDLQEKGPENLVTLIQKAGKVRLGEFKSRTTSDWDRKHGKRGKDVSREEGDVATVSSDAGKLAMDEAASLAEEHGIVSPTGKPWDSVSLFNVLSSGEARKFYTAAKRDVKIDQDMRKKENDWIERELANLEEVDAGEIRASQGDLQESLMEEIRTEGIVDEEKALVELNDFFSAVMPAKEPAIAPKGEFKTAEIPGFTERETFNLAPKETEFGVLKPTEVDKTGKLFMAETPEIIGINRAPAVQSFLKSIEDITADEPQGGYMPKDVISEYERVTGKVFPYNFILPNLAKIKTGGRNLTVSFDSSNIKNKYAYAVYDIETNQIIINNNLKYARDPIDKFDEIIAHEGIHAIIVNLAVTDNVAHVRLRRELTDFVKSVAPHIKTASDEVQIQFKRLLDEDKVVDEIANLAFTNKGFAEWLNSIQAEKNVKGSPTLWAKLKKIILKTIGKVTHAVKTKLDELNQIMDTVFKGYFNERGSTGPIKESEIFKSILRTRDAIEAKLKSSNLHKNVKKIVKEYRSAIKPADITLIEKAWHNPHFMAKKDPRGRVIYERQLARDEERNQMRENFFRDLDDFWNLPESSKPALRDLIWKGDGKKIKGLDEPRFIWNDDGKEIVGLNKKHYAEMEKILAKNNPPEVVKGYVAIRQTLDRVLQEAYTSMKGMKDIDPDTIEAFKKEIGMVQNYFPHHRYGDRFIRGFRKVEGKDEIAVRFHYDDIALKGWALKENALLSKLKSEYPDVTRWEVGKNEKFPDEIYAFPIPVEAMQQIIDRAIENLPPGKGRDAIKELLPQSIADILKTRGWGAHTIKRMDVPGFEKVDIDRVLVDYIGGFTGWLTKAKSVNDFSKALGNINAAQEPNRYVFWSNYIRDVLANSDKMDRLVDGIRSLVYIKFIAGNVKTGIVNLTQNIMAGAPLLSVHADLAGVRYLNAAMDDIVNIIKKGSRLSKDEMAMVHDLYEKGVLSAKFTQEIQGRLSGVIGRQFNKTLDVLNMTMAVPERFNRISMAVAAYRIARAGQIVNKKTLDAYGLTKGEKANHKTAMDFATEVVNDAHFVYGKSNLPELTRGRTKLLRPLYALRSFNHNLYQLWGHMLRQGPRGRKAFAKSLVAMFLLGGLKSVPFVMLLNTILRSITGDDYMDEIRGRMGSWWRDIVTYGVPSIAGVNIGGSLEMMIPDIQSPLADFIGAPGAFYEESVRMTRDISAGQKLKATEDSPLTPMVIRNVMAAARLATTGQRKVTGQPIAEYGKAEPRKLNPFEAAGKAIGFQPLKMTKSYDVSQSLQSRERFLADHKSEFANRYANADSPEERTKVIQDVKAWNKKQREAKRPEYIIDSESFKAAIIRRKKPAPVPVKFRPRAMKLQEIY